MRNFIGRHLEHSRSQRRVALRRAEPGCSCDLQPPAGEPSFCPSHPLVSPFSIYLIYLSLFNQTLRGESDWPSLEDRGVILAWGKRSWSTLMSLGALSCIHQGLFPENGRPEAVTHGCPLHCPLVAGVGWGVRRSRACREVERQP